MNNVCVLQSGGCSLTWQQDEVRGNLTATGQFTSLLEGRVLLSVSRSYNGMSETFQQCRIIIVKSVREF